MQVFAETALLPDRWAEQVRIEILDGIITDIQHPCQADASCQRIAGPLLPGMPNVHSHAFQRAFAGYSERRGPGEDSFWTWRQVMYDFVARISPEQMHDIAAQLYVEMLKAGFTSVAEFHYVHHDVSGAPYQCLTELSDQVIAAAQSTGIAITHLPVLYTHGGFGGQAPNDGQRRFLNDGARYARLLDDLVTKHGHRPNTRIGLAPHSLRAVTEPQLRDAIAVLDHHDPCAPIHLHIAEQIKEVDDCIAWCGQRPVQHLYQQFDVNQRWCLIHATHVEPTEISLMAASKAVVGLCPTTEANLGDGIFPAASYLQQRGRFGVGSDSNVSVSLIEELRILEYGQRLTTRRRAVLSEPSSPSVGSYLYHGALSGGAQALGLHSGQIAPGYRADLIVLDADTPTLINKPGDLLLDAMLFAGNHNPVRDVMVGGQWQIQDRHHAREEAIMARFKTVQNDVRI